MVKMESASIVKAKDGCRIFTAQSSKKTTVKRISNQIPSEILENDELNELIKLLPSNYNFEIHRTIWKIKQNNSKCVALQFPEGLLIFSLLIADIIKKFTRARTIIMGDVTYGACCVDDFTAKALGADFMVHYAHSCLIPITVTKDIKMFYVLVDIKIDTLHFIETVKLNFSKEKKIALVSTVQFLSTLQLSANDLRNEGFQISVPQIKPLSPGEVLGCTAPELNNIDIILYIGDGRFHLESIMIANPKLEAYKYNPYDKSLTKETYNFERMIQVRRSAIEATRDAKLIGIILGTLGRQGSPQVLEHLVKKAKKADKESLVFLMSEIFPARLELYPFIQSWVQIACPRLSIDWGLGFPKPLVTPYEFASAVTPALWSNFKYPMDFYAAKSLGPWTPNHKSSSCDNEKCDCQNC